MKKFNIFLKNFWKFSKSKNRNFLKIFFGQKNYFAVLLRPNYIDLHSFLTQNGKKKISNFLDLEFFPKIKKKLWANFVGLFPTKCSHWWTEIRYTSLASVLKSSGKPNELKKKLNCTMLSPNSVPEGHWQITSKCTKWINTLKLPNKLSWNLLIQGQLLPWGHACPLGGRCFCIRYPVGRGRGPARF